MDDRALVAFLQWALPRNGMRWRGFRKVRRQVGRRLARRLAALGLASLGDYRARLEAEPAEWAEFDALLRITISRFYRDRRVWDALGTDVLPSFARQGGTVRVWSAGCASGEEPYTISLVWRFAVAPSFPEARVDVVATDAGPVMLDRARGGVYPPGALRELPAAWQAAAFESLPDGDLRLADPFREGVTFLQQDLRRDAPTGSFDLVLCRNLAFTYFDEPTQTAVARRIAATLRPGGLLVVATHEHVPAASGLQPAGRLRGAFERAPQG